MSCTGLCRGFENNGVCEVPTHCDEGTDCNDCTSSFPVWQTVALSLHVILLGCLFFRLVKDVRNYV